MKISKLIVVCCLTLLFAEKVHAQDAGEIAIRQQLAEQIIAWNNGNIEDFMKIYWQSDSLMFVGKNGVLKGWNTTLQNYKNNYPGIESMGTLTFDLQYIKKLSDQFYHVLGKWHLKRKIGDIGGYFTLIFQNIDGKWLIIYDHSS